MEPQPKLERQQQALATKPIFLPHKPTAALRYTFIAASSISSTNSVIEVPPIIVFLTGLGTPASSFHRIITSLAGLPSHPALLAYDRYGHGASIDRDPIDALAMDSRWGHDCIDAVGDLHILLKEISEKYKLPCLAQDSIPPVVFVANSIGCAIARLYAAKYPDSVKGLMLLDSVIANVDMVEMFPDPDAVDFKTQTLPMGVTEKNLRETRAKFEKVFGTKSGLMGNGEGLSRRNLKELLPSAEEPKLAWGESKKGPWITVIGHGSEKFAEEAEKVCFPLFIICQFARFLWSGLSVVQYFLQGVNN
jgi:pimeloyl-ACP methyl ester carboxylesterase